MSNEAYNVGKNFGIKPSYVLALKSELRLRPFLVIITGFALTVVISGYTVRSLERSYVSNTKTGLDLNYLTNGF